MLGPLDVDDQGPGEQGTTSKVGSDGHDCRIGMIGRARGALYLAAVAAHTASCNASYGLMYLTESTGMVKDTYLLH